MQMPVEHLKLFHSFVLYPFLFVINLFSRLYDLHRLQVVFIQCKLHRIALCYVNMFRNMCLCIRKELKVLDTHVLTLNLLAPTTVGARINP